MKTIWNKIPAWGKALIFLGIVGMPVRILIQSIAVYNLQDSAGWGWSLLVAVPLLFIFWKLVSRFSPFHKAEDVKISMRVNWKDGKVWARISGLILLGYSTAVLVTQLFDVQQDYLLAFLETFKGIDAIIAIPILMVFALTAGIVEEVVFRGYVQNSLVRAYPKTISFLAIGLVFALVHYLPLPLVVVFLIISSSFCLVADEFKSLGVVIVAHILVDIYGLLEVYYGFAQLTGPSGLTIAAVMFVVSLFLLLKGNASLIPKKYKKIGLVEARAN